MSKKVCGAALAFLFLCHCGGGGEPSDGQGVESRGEAAERRLYSLADPCGGLDESQAAALLDIPVDDVAMSVLEPALGNSCSIKSISQPIPKTIVFNLYEEESEDRARNEYATMVGNFEAVVPAEPIDDLGDEAAWFGEKDPVVLKRLLVRFGNLWLDVVSAPGDLEGACKVAEVVLGNIE